MTDISSTCACCGKEITGLPDVAFDAPHHYHVLSEAEKIDLAKLSSDFCVIEGSGQFIRAVCPLPIAGSQDFFAWGVWVSLSDENFQRYWDSFESDDQSRLGGMFGWLSNRIPGYPDSLNLQTTVVPEDGGQRPMVWINEADKDHPLYGEQRAGITLERLGEIYASQVCSGKDS